MHAGRAQQLRIPPLRHPAVCRYADLGEDQHELFGACGLAWGAGSLRPKRRSMGATAAETVRSIIEGLAMRLEAASAGHSSMRRIARQPSFAAMGAFWGRSDRGSAPSPRRVRWPTLALLPQRSVEDVDPQRAPRPSPMLQRRGGSGVATAACFRERTGSDRRSLPRSWPKTASQSPVVRRRLQLRRVDLPRHWPLVSREWTGLCTHGQRRADKLMNYLELFRAVGFDVVDGWLEPGLRRSRYCARATTSITSRFSETTEFGPASWDNSRDVGHKKVGTLAGQGPFEYAETLTFMKRGRQPHPMAQEGLLTSVGM